MLVLWQELGQGKKLPQFNLEFIELEVGAQVSNTAAVWTALVTGYFVSWRKSRETFVHLRD